MRVLIPIVCLLVAAACGAEEDPDVEGPFDASEPDAGASSASLVVSGTFERPSPACNDWRTPGSSGLRSIPPRSGSYACRVCSIGVLETIHLTQATGPLDAGNYRLVAWVRSRSDRSAPREMVASLIAQVDGRALVFSASTPVLDAWSEVRVPVELPSGASAARVSLQATAGRDDCMFVDDVLFERLPE